MAKNDPPNHQAESAAPSREPKVPDQVVEVAAKAYYDRAVTRADDARNRAQTAFNMVSAIAAAIAAAGIFGGVDEQSTAVQIVGFFAFAFWLIVGALLLWAAVGEYRRDCADDDRNKEFKSGNYTWAHGNRAFIERIYGDIHDERDAVFRRLAAALVFSVMALVMTGLTAALALFR